MAKLMPEHTLPIRGLLTLGGRAVGRDDPSKTDAQKSSPARQAKRTDRKVFLLWKDLDNDRFARLNIIFFAKHTLCLGQQLQNCRTVDRCFHRFHPDLNAICLQNSETLDSITQRHQVVCHNVVLVFLRNQPGNLPANIFIPQSQQVLRQLKPGRGVSWIQFQSFALILRTLLKAVLLGEFFSNEIINPRIVGPCA